MTKTDTLLPFCQSGSQMIIKRCGLPCSVVLKERARAQCDTGRLYSRATVRRHPGFAGGCSRGRGPATVSSNLVLIIIIIIYHFQHTNKLYFFFHRKTTLILFLQHFKFWVTVNFLKKNHCYC